MVSGDSSRELHIISSFTTNMIFASHYDCGSGVCGYCYFSIAACRLELKGVEGSHHIGNSTIEVFRPFAFILSKELSVPSVNFTMVDWEK